MKKMITAGENKWEREKQNSKPSQISLPPYSFFVQNNQKNLQNTILKDKALVYEVSPEEGRIQSATRDCFTEG